MPIANPHSRHVAAANLVQQQQIRNVAAVDAHHGLDRAVRIFAAIDQHDVAAIERLLQSLLAEFGALGCDERRAANANPLPVQVERLRVGGIGTLRHILRRHRIGTYRRRGAIALQVGVRRRRPARRRRDRAVHRALPQGGHRRLDDTQLRTLEERLTYLRELEERRAAILASIEEQGKLTPSTRAPKSRGRRNQAALEDLYLPYKPKRRTKAQIAREAGLEPLADALLADPTLDPRSRAAPTSMPRRGVADVKAALDGARRS
jgi:hypothetical protein